MKFFSFSGYIRRTLILLVFCCTSTLCATAQIQTKFFNSTLGVSTKATFIANLKAKGIRYKAREDGDILFLDALFGGYTWQGWVSFYNEKFTSVVFMQQETLDDNLNVESNSYILQTYNSLESTFNQKYGVYELTSSTTYDKIYNDGKTAVTLKYENKDPYKKQLILFYADFDLLKQQQKSNSDEF